MTRAKWRVVPMFRALSKQHPVLAGQYSVVGRLPGISGQQGGAWSPLFDGAFKNGSFPLINEHVAIAIHGLARL